VEVRRRLYEGGKAAVDAARDPMIDLARLVDPESRAVRQIIETQSEIKEQATPASPRSAGLLRGPARTRMPPSRSAWPSAGVKGYAENGQQVPFQTTLAGLYERAADHGYRPPFDLPQRWLSRKGRLNLARRSTSSARPTSWVATQAALWSNRQGQFVGIIFDGNIQSLVLDFAYTDEQARAMASTRRPSSRPCARCMTPRDWRTNWKAGRRPVE